MRTRSNRFCDSHFSNGSKVSLRSVSIEDPPIANSSQIVFNVVHGTPMNDYSSISLGSIYCDWFSDRVSLWTRVNK